MNKHYCVLWICLVTILYCTTIIAGNTKGAVTFSLGDGYYHFAPKRHIDNTSIPYGELAYNFTNHWGLEGLLGFFTTDSRLPIDDGKEVNGRLLAVNVVYHFFPCRTFEPYLSAGPGILSMRPNGTNADTEGNVNGAIGTQFFFSKMIAYRIEARDVYTIVGGKNDFFINGGVSFLF